MLNEQELNPFEHYTNVFKALSDVTRLKIMWLLLSIDSKICVSEIIDVLCESQYNVSKHLRILKKAGLVYEKKEGKWTFYHYCGSTGYFEDMVKKAILTIPDDKMIHEIERCKKRLAMRVDGKCVVGTESNESSCSNLKK